jgi:hypothetical protein
MAPNSFGGCAKAYTKRKKKQFRVPALCSEQGITMLGAVSNQEDKSVAGIEP